ncbi:hypothetical protein COW99_00460 [Candidatus Roizmanbacteria bacterium CG22_combo_CG10-13_8_21_14_all_38_20]|uniref:Glycosyl transferase family 1 domain-containing protein n=1 Tax=Candidatus Roizmanbacteria bacterium CG22_combo_CG10-13_8_21_14_all_38_20 TaxID=1974862 RepID=A0A2H0BWS5_9BACT|nr:MAG: hypothetical protein COW99_00460 [Candidatus Roizmanbacteria bacterium CG22_combo_CG10-13_8_21_14_all_38_20]PJC30785.1 MAG: hypothetical protein CO050_05175 [Candidatus Roizmanbacteria bacterium CG_4_9_14_0_2_um_filter_38_17]
MKIALIIGALNTKGGGQRQFLQLAQNLQKKGYEITVYTINYNRKKCYWNLCNKLKILTLKHVISNNILSTSRYPLLIKINHFINLVKMGYTVSRYNYDILNPHEWPANWIAFFAKLFNFKKTIIIWTCNDLWHVNNSKGSNSFVSFDQITRHIDILLTRTLANEIVVLDNRIKRLVRKIYKKQAFVIRSGLDRNKLRHFTQSKQQFTDFRKKLEVTNKQLLILSVGIFFPHRRYEDSILAIKNIIKSQPRLNKIIKYIIIGEKSLNSDYYQNTKNLIKQLKLDTIITLITKSVEEHELLKFYNACDIFIFPNDKQTWGLAVTEAMALGKPCIVSKGSGVHEVLTDNNNALLVEPRQPNLITERLLKLSSNCQLRKRIGETAQNYILANYSWEDYTHSMLKIFNSINIAYDKTN